MRGDGGGESVTAISSISASGCTMLTTHLKYGSLLFMFKIVANDMPWGKSKSVLEFVTPLKKRFVPSIKLGPGDVYNLLFGGPYEENVKK